MTNMKLAPTLLLLLLAPFWFEPDLASAQQQAGRAALADEIRDLRRRLKSAEDAYLAPSSADRAAHEEMLRVAGADLLRLMSCGKFDDGSSMLSVRGGGCYYSFAGLTHEYGYGSDVHLSPGHLSTGFAGADYGLLVSLGDVPLDGVTAGSAGVSPLALHAPPAEESGARLEQRRSIEGFEAGGFLYKSRLPAAVNSTYAVRSVNYPASDVLVAFRVLRRDADGSLIVAWKLLKKFEAPKLAQSAAQQE